MLCGGLEKGSRQRGGAWKHAWVTWTDRNTPAASPLGHGSDRFEAHAAVVLTVVATATPLAQERLSQRFPGVQFTVEAKADATYPIVSAGGPPCR